MDECPDLGRFVRGELSAAGFAHRDHLRMAFEMLRRHDFAETTLHFSRALRAMARNAGKPEAFHQTITIAFLAVIAERMDGLECADFSAFERANPDLLDKRMLQRWYGCERLSSERARRTFLLPEPAASAGGDQ